MQFLAFASGFAVALQAAINAHLGTVIHSGLHASLVSFTTGTAVLLLVNAVLRQKPRLIIPDGHDGNPWWMWIGGPLGATFITLNTIFVPIIGTGMTIMALQAGMILSSIIVDRFGILQAPQRPVSPAQLLGISVMLAGVTLARLA